MNKKFYSNYLHDALPILFRSLVQGFRTCTEPALQDGAKPERRGKMSARAVLTLVSLKSWQQGEVRSEEHTSELQSLVKIVYRLLLEKKNNTDKIEND